MRSLRKFANGLILTVLTVAGSYLLATRVLGRLYYLAQLLPLFLVFYLFVAWLVYLSRDGLFAGRQRHQQRTRADQADPLGYRVQGDADALLENKVSGVEMSSRIVLRDGLVQRSEGTPDAETFWHESMYVLVWAAGQLALVAAVLYRWFGIGATL